MGEFDREMMEIIEAQRTEDQKRKTKRREATEETGDTQSGFKIQNSIKCEIEKGNVKKDEQPDRGRSTDVWVKMRVPRKLAQRVNRMGKC